MNKIFLAALSYQKMGFSVIPVKKNKKPYIAWEVYQKERPDPDLIRQWWKKWPSANVAIVTGKISGVTVIDIDTESGLEKIEGLTPENFLTPMATTPNGGQHRYCRYQPGISNRARFIEGCDVRSDGGYIIAPPSRGTNGKPSYAWIPGLSISEIKIADLPQPYLNLLKSNLYNNPSTSIYRGDNTPHDNMRQHATTNDNISFDQGHRDNALFHLANHLVKGGMPIANIQKYLTFFASHCNPPFPEKEISSKIKSALTRVEKQERNLTQELRDWIMTTSGNISTTFVYNCQHLTTREEKKKATVILGRFVKEGLLERVPGQAGVYRRVESECEVIDFKNASSETFNLRWPFGVERLVKIHPKSIVVIAGEANAGKTALMLNIIKLNQNAGKGLFYFSSEMSASELRDRLNNFDDMTMSDWNFQAFERSANFADVIRPDAINLIDFLEMSDNFYQVGGQLTSIFNKLKSGIAIVSLQKAPGASMGRGGAFGLEKPRLYLTVSANPPDGAILKILKAKTRANKTINPNYQQCDFKILQGCKLIQTRDWYIENPK